jgi:hypothetical protein
MLDADPVVCTACGNLHLEGSGGPESVDACAVCDGAVADVEIDDLVGL